MRSSERKWRRKRKRLTTFVRVKCKQLATSKCAMNFLDEYTQSKVDPTVKYVFWLLSLVNWLDKLSVSGICGGGFVFCLCIICLNVHVSGNSDTKRRWPSLSILCFGRILFSHHDWNYHQNLLFHGLSTTCDLSTMYLVFFLKLNRVVLRCLVLFSLL